MIETVSKCNNFFSSKQQTENGEKKKKICQYCSKEFTRTYNLNQHLLVHTGEKKYSCDMCKQEYKSKRNLKWVLCQPNPWKREAYMSFNENYYNLQSTHTSAHRIAGKTKTNWAQWWKTFEREVNWDPNAMVDHWTLKANDIYFCLFWFERKIKMGPDNRYVCEVCAKPFKSLSNYHQHRLVHTNVRKFGCDICKRRYKTKNHLKWVPPMHGTQATRRTDFKYYVLQKPHANALRRRQYLFPFVFCVRKSISKSDKTGWTYASTYRRATIWMRDLSQMYGTAQLISEDWHSKN